MQSRQPVPGQVYNVLSLAMRNGTAQTFDAEQRSGRTPIDQWFWVPRWYPILTGTQQWKPGQFIVFYVLTKKYYPVNPEVSGGFTFNFAPGRVAIPGTVRDFSQAQLSARQVRQDARLDRCLRAGAEGGKGPKLGLPDTAIWEFVSSKTIVRTPLRR